MAPGHRTFGRRLKRQVTRQRRSLASEVAIGVAAALIAVAVRWLLPLGPQQMPTLPTVVTIAIVTTFVGVWCGITTAVLGGLLSWYLFFNPHPWTLANGAWVPLLSFVVISTVIVTTSHLYRSSEQRRHQSEIERLEVEAEESDFFAREMAHRLKNTLAIVQSIAFQTIGTESADASKFASRLKALADANDLLNEHVSTPTADLAKVIESALRPFEQAGERFQIAQIDARIPSQQVLSLALAIHELATNASKYGALSTPAGTVTIRFEERGDRLEMVWVERGGPPVEPPRHPGFGTRLLRRSGMNTEIEFQPEGLRCAMGIRLS